MFRKITGLFLALLLLACASALAEKSPWSYDSSNMILRRQAKLSGDVSIPSEVDGYPVHAIGGGALSGQHAVTSLTMPDSLRALQNDAVTGMDSLTGVTLNDGLEYIGANFRDCGALTQLTIPASVRIVDSMIGSCENLTEIRFEGECPLFLGAQWCFFMMPQEYTIYVPDDQLDAYAAALQDANGAAEHLKPSGRNAVLPEKENNESWFDFDAATGTITGYREYHACVEIPASIGGVAVTTIGEQAFAGDYSVYSLVFPEGLASISPAAFRQASNLCYVRFPSTLKTIGDDAFFNAQIARIDWREGLEDIGARAFQYHSESILALPSTVRTIGESAFEGAWCQELYLGGSIQSIGARAFAGTALTYMAFDLYTPVDIAPDAFADAPLADLDLPWDSSVENRDAYAALLGAQCPGCTVWINNPISGGVAAYPVNEAGITTIENGVWTSYAGDAPDLTVWTNYDGINVTALGDGLFKGSQTIRSFYPHHCGWFTTIGAEAFADSSVETVELFGSITAIGEEAFRNCANITELSLPESLTTIGAGAFKGCTGITELTLPASLTSIGEGALDGCERLARLNVLCDPAILPEGLLDECFAHTQIYAAPTATSEQVARLSDLARRPWYAPVSRVGEPAHDLTVMPDAPLPGEDFDWDADYARLDTYRGYALNLILPREIDGVQLTMIGGGMMSRASCGDNFDTELPVRSLVIPEGYTEIPTGAFMDCDTLETVICYAPLERLNEGVFAGCTSLREVVFVNGVHEIDRYVFDGCLNLQTVYLGAYTQKMDENAFCDAYGVAYFDAAQCITDPAQMPDIDALLAAVKSDPMPMPTPTPAPEPARPVGAEGEAFFGAWHGVSMEAEGGVFSFSDFGMVMELTFCEDGTMSLFDGEETDTASWRVEEGTAIIGATRGSIQADGTLCLDEDGTKLFFVRGAAAGESPAAGPDEALPDARTPAVSGAVPDASASDRLERKYVCESAEVGGYRVDASMLGGEYALTFHADGTADFVMVGTLMAGLPWTQGTVQTEAGEAEVWTVSYLGQPMEAVLTEEGFDMNYFDAMLMHFVPEG